MSATPLPAAAVPQRAPLRLALILAAGLSLALNLRALQWGPVWHVYLFKPLTTVLVLGLALAGRGATDRYRAGVAAGLVLSLAGDVLLMLPGDRFVPGLIAFLLAHLAYLYAFTDGVGMRVLGWPLAVYLAAGAGVLAALWPKLGALRLPVVVYLLVITAMAAQAAGRWLALRRETGRRDAPGAGGAARSAAAAALGAAVFVVSDASLAIDRFGGGFALAGVVVMTTYVAAQLLIASSTRE